MAALHSPRREAFAQGLARGAAPVTAWQAAGFARHMGRANAAAAEKDVAARVVEIALERAGGGSTDLAPLIDRCVALADTAGTFKTAAGMVAARGLLAEAARLKGLLPIPASPPRRRLTTEEWVAEYAPKP
ncbi:MAG: hypothetical protein H0X27_11610 [Caulobacteraceae bacterium]|nr:hypothetical protein [Caulobacteraceae bacterium]